MASPRFWNWIAARYARTPVADQTSYEHKLELTRARLRPIDHVLEVGCGTGTTALWHAAHVAHVEGTDFAPKMIEIAQEKALDVPNATFRVAGVTDPTLRDKYDAILAMSVLHLLPSPAADLKHLAGLLAPGGFLMSSTVCLSEMGGIWPRILPLLSWTGLLPVLTPLSKSDLIDMHKAAGLTIIEEFQPGPGKAVFLIAQAPQG